MPFTTLRRAATRVGVGLLSVCLYAQQNQVPSTEPAGTPPQVKQVLPSYEGQYVSSVEIAGRPDIDVNALKPSLAQQAGQPFSLAKINASIAALKATGKFQDVQLQVVPDIQGVRVLLVLQPGLYFGIYRFPGALTRFTYSRLLQVSNYPPEGPYSIVDVNNATAALTKYFQQSGYFQVRVNPDVQPDPAHGLVNVSFPAELGPRAEFGDVTIEGTTPEETEFLKGKLTTIIARLKGSAIRPGKKYSLRTVQNATTYIENTLIKQDRLAAEVRLIGANYDPETNRADVAFRVNTGPLLRVEVKGARLWSWTRRKLLPVYQQVGIDPEILQEGRQNLISYFEKKGFFDVQVKVNAEQQADGQTILYQITKGARHKVKDVSIAGNQAIDEDELEKQITVKKARFITHGAFSDKLVRQSVKNLEAVYKAAGFSSVKVTPQVKREGGNVAVTFRVEEGPRDVVAVLKIEGNNTMPVSKLAPKGLKLAEGQPYSQRLANEDRTQIVERYLNEGYLTATFRETVKPVEKDDPHRLVVTYHIYEGPRVITNSVVTLGRGKTRQSFIDRSSLVSPGKPLTETQMLTTESQLYEPEIFDWAAVDPRRQITTQSREDVLVKVHEAKPNSMTYGVGFEVINRGGSIPSGTVAVPGVPPLVLNREFTISQQTFWGPRGNFEYTRRNIRGKAETFTITGLAGRLQQRGSITFQNPHFWDTNWTSTVLLNGQHDSTNPIFTSRFATTGFQLQRNIKRDKNKNLFLRYGYQVTGLSNLLIPELVPPEDRHVRLSTLSASFVRDTRDSPLDAHKGIYESFEYGFTSTALGGSVSFNRLQLQTAYYKRLPQDVIWANSLRLGFERPFAGSHVPISEAFFSGGGSTLRGFPLDAAGPQRTIAVCSDPNNPATCSPTNVPTGGNQLVILNSEFRIPLPIKKGLGVVGFYDGGNVFRVIGFHGQYTNTLGFGFRYATPVGPVRIDIGHNLNAPPGITSTQYFITLGQAF